VVTRERETEKRQKRFPGRLANTEKKRIDAVDLFNLRSDMQSRSERDEPNHDKSSNVKVFDGLQCKSSGGGKPSKAAFEAITDFPPL
jgi:hypothetical protein